MQNLSRAYCEDESKKLMHITEIFLEEWRRLDLGANIVAEYIHFCQVDNHDHGDRFCGDHDDDNPDNNQRFSTITNH